MKISSILRLALAGLILLAPAVLCPAQDPVANPSALCSLPNLKDAVRVDGFTFRTYKNGNSDDCFQVLRDGKILFRRTNDNDGWFKLGQPEDKKWKVPAIPNGTDITGRGHPDMIVSFYSGGAHCCLSHYVFELEPRFKLLATLNAEDTWPAYFADLDKNGHYYYIAEDWTFAYWSGSFAGNPVAPIILQFVVDGNGGGYHLALDKMQSPKPTSADWKNYLSEYTDSLGEYGPDFSLRASTIWNTVLKLIYSEHSDLAWKFLDESWPGTKKEKEDEMISFCITLKESPYWPDLEPAIKVTSPICTNAKPDHQK